MNLDFRPTLRGFWRAEFQDRYGCACSLQESSLATEDAIWLGVDRSGDVPSRMHLVQEQAAALWPLLKRFAETGSLRPKAVCPECGTDHSNRDNVVECYTKGIDT